VQPREGAAAAMARLGTILFAAAIIVVCVIEAVLAGDGDSVEDLLVKNGLPRGLLPGTVQSYSLSGDGTFKVTLHSACQTKISTEEVYYKKSITGVLSYGKITNLSGIQAKEFFWISVTSMELDQDDPSFIWFEVGFLSKSLSVDIFQVPPTCNSLAEEGRNAMTFSDWLSKALDGTLPLNSTHSLDAGAARRMSQ
jgi:hypothetical protein